MRFSAPGAPLAAVTLLLACEVTGEPTTSNPPEVDAGRDGGGEEPDAAAPLDGSTGEDAGDPERDGSVGDDAGSGEPPFVLKVLSLNTWSGSAALAAADIVAMGADIVGLQETPPEEAAAIRAALGGSWHFVQEDRVGTHALLSRLPVLRRIGTTSDPRGGVGATIELRPGLRVHLFDTHLMWTPYGPYQLANDDMPVEDVVASENAVRMPALRELLAMAAPYIASDDATFLVGDFNAPSHLDYAPAMPWPTSVAPLEAGLVDSYAELHPDNVRKWAGEFLIDDPGITWTSHPGEEPYGCFDRIDFVYYSRDDAVPVESSERHAESSDHRAVLSTFEITGPQRGERAQNPLPASGDAKAARHPVLTWTPARGATEEHVYLGTSAPDTLVATVEGGRFAPALLAAGTTYRWRVDSVTATGVITGEEWTFTTPPGGGLSLARTRFAPGEDIVIDFDGANAARDWIAMHARTQAYYSGAPGVWKYLNDSDAAPGSTVTSGSITLVAPSLPGEYVLRFFHDDGYSVEDELTLTVQ
jgi:endonuclease/exonuclease/phosphatase (EEP) superfamily protein YafD